MNTLNLFALATTRWRSLLPYTADKRWQHAFARYHDIVNHMAMRWGMYSGALLWGLGALLGMMLRPWNTEALLHCLGIALPFYIAVGVAVGNPRFRGHYQWLAALGNLTSGLLLFPVAARLPEPELTMLVGLIIITFHAVTGLRLRLIYALPVMVVYNGLFIARLWRIDTIRPETAVVVTSLVCIAFT